jgi:hypothetical protein
MTEKMSLIDRLENIDPRVIYWLLVIVIAIPYINPIGLPVPISEKVREAYQVIDELNEGDSVLFYVPAASGWSEIGPSEVAVFKQLISKKVKVIITGRESDAPLHGQMIFDAAVDYIDDFEAVYGVDYVNMGWVPGVETGIASIAADPRGTWKTDVAGTSVDNLMIMDNIEAASDFDLIVNFDLGENAMYFARHWVSPLGVQQVVFPTAVTEAQILPFYDAGLVRAYATGLGGGASWELMIKSPGEALIGMDAISSSHALFLFFILIGNLFYLLKRPGGDS